METWKHNNRAVMLFFTVAVAVHVVVFLIPVTQKMVTAINDAHILQVRLVSPSRPEVVEQVPAPPLEWPESQLSALEDLPPAPAATPPPVPEVVQRPSSTIDRKRVLSSQFNYESAVRQPLFGKAKPQEEAPDYYVRQRTSMEMALNQPVLQLPFEDTRIYLVDSYEEGFMGGFERFWDDVSVPFGFTTKNNTRVQCVWVLVIAGCGWGHKTLFHRAARYREKPKEAHIENS
ncbi:hypothetical protein ACFL07_09650 [Pseudomonadota bacterium]